MQADTLASGQAQGRGSTDARTANGASTAISASAASSQRDGRHSSRQLPDALHQGVEFGIRSGVVAHEPVPELVVFGVQQP